jgi:hypothetical protein
MTSFETVKKIHRTLKFSEVYTETGEYAGGGIDNSVSHIEDDMRVEITDDPIWDNDSGEFFSSGRPQIHIGGTRRAFEELGVFLLALAHYRPREPGYSMSFNLENAEGDPALHLVIHLPQDDEIPRAKFPIIHTFGRAYFNEDGQLVEDKTPKPKSRGQAKLGDGTP